MGVITAGMAEGEGLVACRRCRASLQDAAARASLPARRRGQPRRPRRRGHSRSRCGPRSGWCWSPARSTPRWSRWCRPRWPTPWRCAARRRWPRRAADLPVVVVASDAPGGRGARAHRLPHAPRSPSLALARAMRYAAWRRVTADDAPPADPARTAAARAWAAARLVGRGGAPERLPAMAAAELLAPYGIELVGRRRLGERRGPGRGRGDHRLAGRRSRCPTRAGPTSPTAGWSGVGLRVGAAVAGSRRGLRRRARRGSRRARGTGPAGRRRASSSRSAWCATRPTGPWYGSPRAASPATCCSDEVHLLAAGRPLRRRPGAARAADLAAARRRARPARGSTSTPSRPSSSPPRSSPPTYPSSPASTSTPSSPAPTDCPAWT